MDDGGTRRAGDVDGDAAARSAGEATSVKDQHPGVAEVQHLVSRGAPDPGAIAQVLHRNPAGKNEILALLHQTFGNAFVLGVMTAARPPGTPNTMRVTASALHVRSTPDKSKDDNIIGLLPHHAIVKTTDDHREWVGIDHHGKPAFVYAQYVEPLPKEPADAKPADAAAHDHQAPTPAASAAPARTPAPAPTPAPTPSAAPTPAVVEAPAPSNAAPATSSVGPTAPGPTPSPAPAPAPAVSPAPELAPTPSAVPAVADSPIMGPSPAMGPTSIAGPSSVMTPMPVAAAGAVHASVGAASGGTIDELRAAVAKQSHDDALAAYHKLSASAKTQLRAELVLLGALLGVLDSANALIVLDEVKLGRAAALQVGALARPADGAFLGQVLHHLHLDSIANVSAAAGDLLANPAYLPLLDHIINGKGVTGKQQLALATSSAGITLLERIYPGLSPLAVLPALGADPAAQRDGYERSAAFGDWLFTDPAALEAMIKLGTDGAKWGRSMWGGRHQKILLGWIASDQAYWGNAFGTALLKPDGDDAAALRSLKPVAAAVFGVIAGTMSVEILIQVFAALKFTLPEWINALADAGRLDLKSLELALDGPNIGPAEHEVLAVDDAAIARIRQLTPGKRASEVLAQLPSEPARFCAAVGRGGAFSKWVTEKLAVLAAEMLTVVNWNAWMTAFMTLNDPLLFLSAAAHPALQGPLRTAMIPTDGWAWLLKTIPHPVPTQTQVDVLFKLFQDGSGIKLVDKYAMWDAIYRTPLKRKGNDDIVTWADSSKGETGEKRFHSVDPSDQAMNWFFQMYGQMPRTHVETANAVVMCNTWTVKKTFEVPGSDGKMTKTTNFYDEKEKVTTTPDQPMTTSFYWGYSNTVYMKATDPSGSPDAAINGDDFKGKAGEISGAVNRTKLGLADPDMSFFQNHATHEIGHAVGEKTLSHGKYNVKGNEFCRQYGQWKDGGSALDYARMLGFSSALDSKRYDLRAVVSGVPRVYNYSGAEIRNFLTGIVEGGLASQASSKIGTDLGSPDDALTAVIAVSDIGSTVLAKTVLFNKGNFPGAGWQFPHGINGEQNTVTMIADGKWQQYHASIYNHRVSSYSTYSLGENFAEMYTARYTNGYVPPPIGGLDIADFFNELNKAEPSELGLAAPAATASPGVADAKAPAAPAPGGGTERVSS